MKKLSDVITAPLLLAVFGYATAQTSSTVSVKTKQTTTTNSSTPASSKTQEELMKITQELTNADSRDIKKVFEKYLADNYFHTGPGGKIVKKAEVLKSIEEPETATYLGTDFEDIQVQDYGNTAGLSLKGNYHSERNGEKITESYRATDVFIKQKGEGKILSVISPLDPLRVRKKNCTG
ncbi:hypothetical protein AHMF7605_27335 [Adhaeribacter arboris]|uniref:DUF4440 domain-containing protein n=1 Tax=Adhaeribacter arboris TaxID=2072846 RepID=A0A2T2YN56_9BACT|nr:nuclear transport factor 2 family protein [Adhaeribacter arboris]PSR56943.1 hypothetical protein AHMF7605_27335 [Adhaeribacter arboris]